MAVIGTGLALASMIQNGNAELRADIREVRSSVEAVDSRVSQLDQRLSRIEGHLLGINPNDKP